MPLPEDDATEHSSEANGQAPGEESGSGTLTRIPEALLAQAGLGSWHWEIGPDLVTWSPELRKIFRVPPGQPAPTWKEHKNIYEPVSFQRLKDAVEHCLASGTPYRLLLEARKLDSSPLILEAHGAAGVRQDGKATHMYGVCIDRTEELLAKRRAEQSQQKCEAIFRQAGVGLALVDAADGLLLDVNRGLAVLLGTTEERLKNLRLVDLFDPDGSNSPHIHSIRSFDWPKELPLRRSDNTIAWTQVSISPVLLEGQTSAYLVLFQDVDRRRSAEEAKKRAEIAMERAVVEERQQFARYIHDGTGQLLTALSLQSAALCNIDLQNPDAHRTATRVHDLACEVQRRLRALVRGLAPVEITTQNFVGSLRDLAENFASGFGAPVVCRVPDGWQPCCDSAALSLYLIVQEAALNAVRHSGANEVEIGVQVGRESAILSVTDNGVGFVMTRRKFGGVGLKSMEIRASAAGGSLKIASAPGKGTRVSVTVPHQTGCGTDNKVPGRK